MIKHDNVKNDRIIYAYDSDLRRMYIEITKDSLYFSQRIKQQKCLENLKDTVISFSTSYKKQEKIIITKPVEINVKFNDFVDKKEFIIPYNTSKEINFWKFDNGEIPILDTIFFHSLPTVPHIKRMEDIVVINVKDKPGKIIVFRRVKSKVPLKRKIKSPTSIAFRLRGI